MNDKHETLLIFNTLQDIFDKTDVSPDSYLIIPFYYGFLPGSISISSDNTKTTYDIAPYHMTVIPHKKLKISKNEIEEVLSCS
ncbi:hypothetical protein QE152_g22775 [Popillia japonica]|uniref:Uncharacterized protein n=1 Tax=Popillia japonica TaxID=7064 RepID=A0AAW1KJ73_POPJA